MKRRTEYWLADESGPRSAWGFHTGPGSKQAAIRSAKGLAETVHNTGDRVVRVVKIVTIVGYADIASFPSPPVHS